LDDENIVDNRIALPRFNFVGKFSKVAAAAEEIQTFIV